MNSRLTRFLCLSLSVILIIGCMTVPVFAGSAKEIVFDDKSHFESVCESGQNEFSLSVSEKAAFFFLAIGNAEQLDYKITNTITKADVDTFDCVNEYGLYKSVVLDKGSYDISLESSVDCILTVERTGGYLLIEANGTEEIYNVRDYFPQYIYLDKGDTAKISFIALDGENHWIGFDGEYKDSIELKAGEQAFFSGEGTSATLYVYKNVETKFTCDPIRFVLADEGDNVNISFPYTYSFSSDKARPYLYYSSSLPYEFNKDEFDFNNIRDPLYIDMRLGVYDLENIYYTNLKFSDLFIFVKETSKANKLVTDTDIMIDFEEQYTPKEQAVYVFTPEKDGYCTLTSSGDGADPVVAVFDESDNLIDWYQDSVNPMDLAAQRRIDWKTIDYNLNLNTELKGGQTYYFYLMNINQGTNPDFTIKMSYVDKDGVPVTVTTEPTTPDPVKPDPVKPDPVKPDPSKPDPNKPDPAEESEPTFSDFVERLYVVALGRASEPEGKAFWSEHVGNGDLTGAACANEFLLSKEFKDRGLNDEQFLEVLYKTFFDRKASDDPDGFNFWMNSLKTQGRDVVVDCFINSTEWCNVCATYGVKSGATRAKATIASKNATAFATRLYTECLGRDPEEGGLKFWSLGLTNLELTGSAAAHEFFFCKEFNDHNFDNKELITRMYRTFMGREPDDAGMTFWLDSMGKGMTKQDVFDCFVKSPEFTQICKDYAIERG